LAIQKWAPAAPSSLPVRGLLRIRLPLRPGFIRLRLPEFASGRPLADDAVRSWGRLEEANSRRRRGRRSKGGRRRGSSRGRRRGLELGLRGLELALELGPGGAMASRRRPSRGAPAEALARGTGAGERAADERQRVGR